MLSSVDDTCLLYFLTIQHVLPSQNFEFDMSGITRNHNSRLDTGSARVFFAGSVALLSRQTR